MFCLFCYHSTTAALSRSFIHGLVCILERLTVGYCRLRYLLITVLSKKRTIRYAQFKICALIGRLADNQQPRYVILRTQLMTRTGGPRTKHKSQCNEHSLYGMQTMKYADTVCPPAIGAWCVCVYVFVYSVR